MTTGWMSWGVDVAWKAAIVLVLATLATHLMRRRSAAARHAVWLTAVLCLLLLPALSSAFPSWTLPIPVLTPPVPPAPEALVPPDPGVPDAPPAPLAPLPADEAMMVPAPPPPPDAPPAPPAPPSRAAMLLFVGWLAGAAVVLTRLLRGHERVRRMGLHAAPLRDPMLLRRAHAVADSLGIRRELRVLEGEPDAMPMTFGVRRARLLLPSTAASWTAARQDAVLRHELAHVRRRDSLTQLLAGVACVLYWFNPLVWLAAHRMCVEREHACDDIVLAGGSRATEYAAELLDIARGMRVQHSTALAAIAMARPSQLRRRLAALLEERRRTDHLPTRLLVPAWVGALALLIPLSSVTPSLVERDVAPAASSSKPRSSWSAPQPESKKPPAHAGPAVPASPQEDCLSGRDRSVNTNHNDESRTIRWRGVGCSGEVVIEGDVHFDADFRRITGFSRNGYLRITTDEGRGERRVEVRPASNRVTYEYSVDGSRRTFDADAQAWLDRTMLLLFRGMGFMADERAAAMLQRGGAQAVLAEVELLRGDYVRAAYLGVLVAKGRLDEATLRRVLALAGSTIDSDYYVTSIVTRVAGNYPLTDAVRNAYIEAVTGVDSDYYRYTAFSALMKEGEPNATQMSALLRESRRIESDYYRAALLGELNDRYGMSPEIRSAYLESTSSISSDYYKAEVLSGLMMHGGLDAAALSHVADAAATIDSDHYRTAVLTTFVDAGAFDDATMHRAFVRAAQGIDSDHDLHELLLKLAGRSDVDDATMSLILEAAGSIESDHYRSVLLTGIARRHRLDGENRARFMKLMDAIGSETYRGRVASALLRRDG